jgi:protein O-GlcNAc transferase
MFRAAHKRCNLNLTEVSQTMTATATLTMVDEVRVVVPDSLDLITPYVLLEQQDWFEDEIKFLRHLLQPGQKVIDIGANYGVYALSMAQAVGPTGRVWAFEPASGTARLLAEGIAVNGFTQVFLEQSALSSSCGTAQLSLNKNSELNALVHGQPSTSAVETVPVLTLDDWMRGQHGPHIDFMKIDAEGEEANILQGGKRFFAELSPLVQYEIKAGADLHLDLVHDFAALGYDSYRLVPGLNLLVRFDAESPPDGYLLNLFCCKPDRAERLAAQGFLVAPAAQAGKPPAEQLPNSVERRSDSPEYDWRHTIGKLPYGAELASLWEQTMAAGGSAVVDQALSFYAISQDSPLPPADRWVSLEASFSLLKTLCDSQPSHLRLASLARVARAFGARSLAVSALQQLANAIFEHGQIDPGEPFLVPGERFDAIPPGDGIGNWVLAAVLEETERLGSFSSFYTGVSAQQRLEMIRDLGFGSSEMARRLRLLQNRFGLPAS